MSVLTPSFVSTLGWALVHFLWQGLALGMAAAVALMLLRNARPQLRYAVACLALALCVVLPVAGMVRGLYAEASVTAQSTPAIVHAVAATANLAVVPPTSWRTMLQTRLPWIVALWSLGAGLLALRMALGLAWVDRARRAHASVAGLEWQARFDRLVAKFRLCRDVSLRVVGELDSPVAAGCWRPMVLVPAALIARMPPELLEALLAHELAHIKRHDYLVNLIQSAIEALLFYHPVVWWLSKQIRIERELIADDLAAQAIGERRRVALALQQLDLLLSSKDRLYNPRLAPAANGANLMSRIQHLVRPGQHALSWKVALPIVGLSAICLTVFAQGNTPAAAAKPAAASAASDTRVTRAVIHEREEAYALIREGREGMTVSGTTRDIRDAEKARRSLQGDFLWFRRGDKSYVVQDPALLAKATEAWKPTEALSVRMEALGDEMEAHGKVMEGLGKKMEALSARGDPASVEMEQVSSRMETLSQQQGAIGGRMEKLSSQMMRASDDDEREALDRKMEALQAQMEPLQAQMEKLGESMNVHARRMTEAQKPMEALSQQMQDASKPMDALGKQMDALGEQQEQLSRAADRVLRTLIDDALKNGQAVSTSTLH